MGLAYNAIVTKEPLTKYGHPIIIHSMNSIHALNKDLFLRKYEDYITVLTNLNNRWEPWDRSQDPARSAGNQTQITFIETKTTTAGAAAPSTSSEPLEK